MAVIKSSILFSANKPKPLKGFPEGKYRIRIRNDDYVFVFVRTFDGIRQFTVKEENGHWVPMHEIARNISVQ